MNHAMSLEEDEYIFTVPVWTTLGLIKEKLLETKFRKFGWLQDELLLWERAHTYIELDDLDDFDEDTTLGLTLVNKHEVSEEEEEEESEDSD